MEPFSSEGFLPRSVIDRITDVRVSDPDRPRRVASERRRRESLTTDGKLNVLAADHPARRVTRVGDDPMVMADRGDYLARLARVLLGGAVDGVMSTMDVIDDLLILHDLLERAGGPSLLGGKLLIASINRGGLAGSAWELDDPPTGATVDSCASYRLDGAKLLLRVADDDPASLRTLEACASAVSKMNAIGLPTFLEPLPVKRGESGLSVQKDAGALARLVGVASALGDSSRRLWLKLPHCARFEQVARATTLPILLLGGEATADPRPLIASIADGLRSGANVRGALIGRNVLYPGGGADPLALGRAIDGMVHRGWDAAGASGALERGASEPMDTVSRWLA